MYKKLGVIILLVIMCLFIGAAGVSADTSDGYGSVPGYGSTPCNPVSGASTPCPTVQFTISKMVKDPNTGNFVDNLGINDDKYTPNSTINFKIDITNTGVSTINQVNVTDVFPQFLTYLSGVNGSYNQNTQTLTFSITNLQPGQTQELMLVTQAVDSANFPTNTAIVCPINQVSAIELNTDTTASASSQVCIEKVNSLPTPQVFQTPPIKQTPPTGPEMLPLLGLIPAGISGFLLRRKRLS